METEQLTLHHGPLAFSAISMAKNGGSGPTVLCLHGFPDNATSFRHQLPFLAGNGYRAVAVTLRGYEPSSIPADDDYSMQALVSDVLGWVEELGGEPVHIVGHDWGAAITYSAAAFAPDKFLSATAMAVPHPTRFGVEARRHPKQALLSWYMIFFQLRGLSERVASARDYAFIKWLWRKWSPGWAPSAEEMESVIATLRQPGVIEASLGYYRAAIGGKKPPKSEVPQQHFKLQVPVLAMTGAQDGCIDSEIFEELTYGEDFEAELRLERIIDAGHFLHQEKPEECNAIILDWLNSH